MTTNGHAKPATMGEIRARGAQCLGALLQVHRDVREANENAVRRSLALPAETVKAHDRAMAAKERHAMREALLSILEMQGAILDTLAAIMEDTN